MLIVIEVEGGMVEAVYGDPAFPLHSAVVLDHDVEHEEPLTSFALPNGRRIEVAVIEMGIETRDRELMEAVKRRLKE